MLLSCIICRVYTLYIILINHLNDELRSADVGLIDFAVRWRNALPFQFNLFDARYYWRHAKNLCAFRKAAVVFARQMVFSVNAMHAPCIHSSLTAHWFDLSCEQVYVLAMVVRVPVSSDWWIWFSCWFYFRSSWFRQSQQLQQLWQFAVNVYFISISLKWRQALMIII